MRKCSKRLPCLFLCLLLIFGAVLPAKAADYTETPIGRSDHVLTEVSHENWPASPSVNADTAILIELNSGVILYEKNMHQQMFPASVTKILTALTVIESDLDLGDTVTVSHNAVTDLVWGGADGKGRFYEGQTFNVKEGLYAFFLDSVNTIGYAFAEMLNGDCESFGKVLTERAKELGALHTEYHNPHGLNDQRHLTTAYDLSLMLWEASENDLFRQIAGTREFSFADGRGQVIDCSHGLAQLHPAHAYYNEFVVCGKTGYTSEAMYTRAVYAKNGDLDLIAVTMHSDSKELSCEDINKLTYWGFENFTLQKDAPRFDESGSRWKLDEQEQPVDVIYHAGAVEYESGAALLIPKRSRDSAWKSEISMEDGAFRVNYFLDGVKYASSPLFVEIFSPEEETEPPTTERVTLPGKTDSSKEKKTSEASTEAGREEKEPSEDGGLSGGQIAAIVAVSLIIIGETAALIVLNMRMNELRTHLRRRNR